MTSLSANRFSDNQRGEILRAVRSETLSVSSLHAIFRIPPNEKLPTFPLYGRRFNPKIAKGSGQAALEIGYVIHGTLVGVKPGVVVLLPDPNTHPVQSSFCGLLLPVEDELHLVSFVNHETTEQGTRLLLIKPTGLKHFPRLHELDFIMTIEATSQWRTVDPPIWAALTTHTCDELMSFMNHFIRR